MKRKIWIIGLTIVFWSCSGAYREQKLTISRGPVIPPQFVTVESYLAHEITIRIHVKFTQSHLYHILADESGQIIAERWFPTSKDGTGRYSITLEAKEGFTFVKGQKVLLCIGTENPEELLYRRNTYQCLANIWLTLN